MAFFTGIVASFLVAFPALVSIVNPIGGALIYSQITASREHSERVVLAWRIALYSTIVMLASLLVGATLMSFFGVSIEALRVAGGAVVAASAWTMLTAPQVNEDRKQEQASGAGKEDGGGDVAFFPLTMPFTTGPGTISVAIALSANRPAEGVAVAAYFVGASAAAAAVAVSVGLCYASADRVTDFLGPARARVFARLSAFLLLCIGTQIFITGVQGVLVTALARHG
jgi:multiple antibiotic resistance protein